MKIIKRIILYIPRRCKLFITRFRLLYKTKIKVKDIFFSVFPLFNGNPETLFLRPELRKSVLRIVHIGVRRSGNAGDTLLFPALRALLQKHLAPIEFTLINFRDPVTQESIDLINSHDGVIIGGGGLFLKDTNYNQISGWQWACPENLLEKISVPIIVFAVGYNRFREQEEFDSVFKENINLLLEKSAFFALRNTGSIEEIKKYVKPSLYDKLLFQPCPTTLLSKFYPYKKLFNGNGKILALNIPFDRSNLRYCGQESVIFKSIAEAVKEIEAKGWKVLLYNHLKCDDEAAVWLDKYGVSPPQLYINLPPKQIIRFYNYANAVIGGRGHAQMIPFGLNIPIFSLISHNKLSYFLEDIKHPEWGEEISSPLLKDKIINFINSVENDNYNLYLTEAQNSLWLLTMDNMEKLKRVFG